MSHFGDHLPFAIFCKDSEGRFLDVNEKLLQDFGFSNREEILGKTDADLPGLTPEQVAHYVQCDRAVLLSGNPMLNIGETQRRPGQAEAYLITHKFPLKDDEGKIVGIVGIYVETSSEALQSAIRVFQHELNNRMSAILMHAELALTRLTDAARVQRSLDSIIENVRKCHHEVSSLRSKFHSLWK